MEPRNTETRRARSFGHGGGLLSGWGGSALDVPGENGTTVECSNRRRDAKARRAPSISYRSGLLSGWKGRSIGVPGQDSTTVGCSSIQEDMLFPGYHWGKRNGLQWRKEDSTH